MGHLERPEPEPFPHGEGGRTARNRRQERARHPARAEVIRPGAREAEDGPGRRACAIDLKVHEGSADDLAHRAPGKRGAPADASRLPEDPPPELAPLLAREVCPRPHIPAEERPTTLPSISATKQLAGSIRYASRKNSGASSRSAPQVLLSTQMRASASRSAGR